MKVAEIKKIKVGNTVRVNQGEKFESYVGEVLSITNGEATIRNLCDDIWVESIKILTVL